MGSATGWKRGISLVATAIVVGLVGLEINLRVFGGPIEIMNPLNGFHDGDPVLGWRGKSNITRRFHTPEFDVVVQHDEEGFRRPAPSRPAEATQNILILGDSLGWGWGVAQGELFSDRLQEALAPDVAIYNRSVNAYSTGQEYLLLQQELARRAYDGVLLIVSRTDIGDNVDDKKHRPGFRVVDGELVTRNQPPPGALKNPVERFIDDHSYAINFLSWQLAALKRWWQDEPRPGVAPPPSDPVATSPVAAVDARAVVRELPGYGVTERLLEEIVRTCQREGIPLYLAYATTFLHHRDQPIEVGFRDLVAEVADRSGAPFFDLNETLAPLYGEGQIPLIPGDGHWSAVGHRAVAEVFLTSGVLTRG